MQDIKTKKPDTHQCPLYKKCGGCDGISCDYKKHLKEKEKRLSKELAPFVKLEKLVGMDQPYHYRHKVTAAFGEDRKHNIISGIYEEKSHKIVPVDSCLLENEKSDEIIVTIRKLMKSFKIRPYNEDTGYGLLRHVLVRTGYYTGQIMVVLVLSSVILPSKNNFVKALLKEHPEITTIVLNVNEKKTTFVLGDRNIVLYGKGYIEDRLCEKVFKLSPTSFYQINPEQTEKLYHKAIEYAGLSGKEKVIDAYCGTGTIGIIASQKAKSVIGVELNREAIKDAVINAKLNQVQNICFYNQDATEFMIEQAQKAEKVDVVLMDPPRSGSTESFLDSVVRLKPRKVVYVSCNPTTLVRDLVYITKKGYKVEKACGFDLFCWTSHVETVCLLSRKAPV